MTALLEPGKTSEKRGYLRWDLKSMAEQNRGGVQNCVKNCLCNSLAVIL